MQTYLLNNYNLTFFEAELGEASSPPFLLFFLKTEDYFIAAHHRHSELHRDSRQDTSKAKTLKPFAFSRKPAVSQKKKKMACGKTWSSTYCTQERAVIYTCTQLAIK